MNQNDTVVQNMIFVNDLLVRAFKLLLLVIALIVIIKAAGFIELSWAYLLAAAGTGAVACILPISCRSARLDGIKLRYVNIYCAAVLSVFAYCCLGMGSIMLLVVPIGFACLYFDIKLIRHSVVLSLLGLILGKALNGFVNQGFLDILNDSYIGTAVYILQFGIIMVLMAAISKRALRVINYIYSFNENINDIFSNVQTSSQSLENAENILLQGVSSLSGSNGISAEPLPEEEASSANTKVKTIISNINKSVGNAKEIIKYTQAMLKSKGKENNAEDETARLEEYRKKSGELISKLSMYTNRINEDLRLISVMIDESRLISLNAAAEAENASSGGKGSAIIAMKVEKLADESAESAIHIQKILNNVVNDAESAMKSIAETYEEVFKSLELINRTVETLIKWLMLKNIK